MKYVILSTLTEDGHPWPNPVWFVGDEDRITVYASSDSKKVENLTQCERCVVMTPPDEHGHAFKTWKGKATLFHGLPLNDRDFLDKYAEDIESLARNGFGPPLHEYNDAFDVRIEVVRTSPSPFSTP